MYFSLRPSPLNKLKRTPELHTDTQFRDYHVLSSPVSFLRPDFGKEADKQWTMK
jgi:hypothetical protein